MGQAHDTIISRPESEYIPNEQKDVFWKIDDEVFRTGRPNENEEVLTDGTGALRVIVARKRLIHLPTQEGKQPFIVGVISDVTRFREAEARAQYLAEHDTLTGLANRTQLNDRFAVAIAAASRSGAKVALLLLDLDGFKAVNDRYGHGAGDELLRVIAKRLAGLVRSADTLSRFGGDEFCIVQAAVEQPGAAFRLAERIISSISQPIVIGSSRMSVSSSVGIALFPDDGVAPKTLLHKADMALYAVKRSGRRGYLRYDGGTSVLYPAEWDVEGELRVALAGDQLSLAFQPLAAAEDGKVRGLRSACPLEASGTRGHPAQRVHPCRGVDRPHPPARFLGPAERLCRRGELAMAFTGLRERLADSIGKRRTARNYRERTGGVQSSRRSPRTRDHGDGIARRRRANLDPIRQAQGSRGRDGAGRFRRRLVVAGNAAEFSIRSHQDRPQLHRQHRIRRAVGCDRAGDPEPRTGPQRTGHCGGHRSAGTTCGASANAMRGVAGLYIGRPQNQALLPNTQPWKMFPPPQLSSAI